MSHSKSAERPEKPYADFPLHPHASGQWAKKFGKRRVYFGSWVDDPKGEQALARYHDQIAGRPAQPTGLTVADLCNAFLTVTEDKAAAGEVIQRTFKTYKGVAAVLVEIFGAHRVVETLTARDFEQLKTKASHKKFVDPERQTTTVRAKKPTSVRNFITVVRMIFRYAYQANLVDREVKLGPAFKPASRKEFRKARANRGELMFEAKQIHKLLEAADVQLKAMILLGANCGFGNADCGQLPISAIDFAKGWLRFPRPKTGIDRRCPLWPETLAALREALDKRKAPTDPKHAGLLFVTKYGDSWHKETSDNPITQQFKKLLKAAELYRAGLGFYSIRRGFETIAAGSRDQVAVDFIMGHAEDADDMAAVYRQRIEDSQLQAVVDHVHAWLYPPAKKEPKRRAKAAN